VKRVLKTILLTLLMVMVMATAAVYADPGDAGNQNQSAPPSPPVIQSSVVLVSK
jgi:hypothetical protein